MPDSPAGTASEQEGTARLVSIPEMPDLLEAAGLKRVGPPRIRQLAADPASGFPAAVYERGRLRLWDWNAVLAFFSTRVLRPGERTDLKRKQEVSDDASHGADDTGSDAPPRSGQQEDR